MSMQSQRMPLTTSTSLFNPGRGNLDCWLGILKSVEVDYIEREKGRGNKRPKSQGDDVISHIGGTDKFEAVDERVSFHM